MKKTALVRVSEIQYDIDGVSVASLTNEGAFLPSEMEIEVELTDPENGFPEIADAISDATGFCVLSFQYLARCPS
jgi:hypothetical protein